MEFAELVSSSYVVAGTGASGYRPEKFTRDWLFTQMEDLAAHSHLLVMSGGALGWDRAVASTAHVLGIPYVVVLPSPDYIEYYWGRVGLLDNARSMLEGACHIEYVCDSHRGFSGRAGSANFDRNAVMVGAANEFVVYDAGSPGTRHAVKLIDAAGKPKRMCPLT